jgi:ElaB/YqjD/DUF883 family membrane-anchored ribosome-binding protein
LRGLDKRKLDNSTCRLISRPVKPYWQEMNMDQAGKTLPANGSGTVARAVDEVGARAHSAIDRMSSAAIPAVNRAASGAHGAVDSATHFASGAVDSVSAKADRLQIAHARMTDECRGYVRANPLASVGIAVAAGYLLSMLLRNR